MLAERRNGDLFFSAARLVRFRREPLCRGWTWYAEVAKGALRANLRRGDLRLRRPGPSGCRDGPLARKGSDHEQAFLERLRAEGKQWRTFSGNRDARATVRAMESGADAIYQPCLEAALFGYADFLIRRPGGANPATRSATQSLPGLLNRSSPPVKPLFEMLGALQGKFRNIST